MDSKRSRLVRQTTITTALLLAAQVVGTIPAHAQAAAHGITAGEGMLPPDLASSTRFHDPEIARVVNGHLASMGQGYSACDARRYWDGRSALDGFRSVLEQMQGRWSRGEVNTRTTQIQRLIESGESRIGAEMLASPSGVGDAISGDTQKLSEDIAALRALGEAIPTSLPDPCPPERNTYLQAFGSIGVIEDLGIANAGLGGSHDLTVHGGGLRLSVPVLDEESLTFTFHYLTGDAAGSAGATGVDSVARTFVQPDGQTQFIPVGLNVTGATIQSDYREIGGAVGWEFAFGLGAYYDRFKRMPRGSSPTSSFGAAILAGVTQIRHDERLRVDYDGIGFFVDEQREVDTTRLDLEAEFDVGFDWEQHWARLRAKAKANLDIVDGRGTYHTGQTGNFDETVIADLSRTAITFAFGVEAEAGVEIAEGVTLVVVGSAGRTPIWSLVPREGAEARLEHDMHTTYGVSAGIMVNW